jgi:hypothetical protein
MAKIISYKNMRTYYMKHDCLPRIFDFIIAQPNIYNL